MLLCTFLCVLWSPLLLIFSRPQVTSLLLLYTCLKNGPDPSNIVLTECFWKISVLSLLREKCWQWHYPVLVKSNFHTPWKYDCFVLPKGSWSFYCIVGLTYNILSLKKSKTLGLPLNKITLFLEVGFEINSKTYVYF